MTGVERRFVRRAIARRRWFAALSGAGVAVALVLAVYYGLRRFRDPRFEWGARAVVVLLVLLNARQQLRQYRYASVLKKLDAGGHIDAANADAPRSC